jgi:membrane-associated phospholipid phosphatase
MITAVGPSATWSRACAAVAALLVVGLALLTVAVGAAWPPLGAIDRVVESAVHDWALAHSGAIVVVRAITALGSPLAMDLVAGVAAVVAWVAHRRAVALAVVAVRLVELVIETGLKAAVDRPRPAFDPPLATASSSSFPSGHAAGTAAVVGVLVLSLLHVDGRRWWRWTVRLIATTGVAFTLAVAISRVVLGVHYLSDVTAGVALGSACAFGCAAVLGCWPRARWSESM